MKDSTRITMFFGATALFLGAAVYGKSKTQQQLYEHLEQKQRERDAAAENRAR